MRKQSKDNQFNLVPIFTLKTVRNSSVRYPVSKVAHQDNAVAVLENYLFDKDCEHLVILMMDGNNNFLGLSLINTGGISGLNVSTRDVFKHAITHRASAILLSHNHPSSDPNPSKEDIAFTETCIAAGKMIGVHVVDHIIISSGITRGSYSFLAHNLLF